MWLEILCGLVICILVCAFFSDDDIPDDDILDLENSEADAIFTVVDRLEKLYNGKVYVGLRIPDADSGSRQNIDMVLVIQGEAAVVSFKNLAGFLTVKPDGGWLCISDNKQREVHHPDPVVEAKRQAIVLEGYLERRGVALPEGYISCKVIIPDQKFCILNADYLPSEVIPYNEWAHVKSEAKSMLSSWFKGAVRSGKKEMQESMQHQLDFALSTAPVWDRLEVKGVRYLLGEFLKFKGKHDDIQALQHIKRSKVGRIAVRNMSIFGFAVEVLSSERDYRTEGASGAEWRKVTVSSSTELVFQPQNSKKIGFGEIMGKTRVEKHEVDAKKKQGSKHEPWEHLRRK